MILKMLNTHQELSFLQPLFGNSDIYLSLSLVFASAAEISYLFCLQHRIPTEYHDREPRINLTYRYITKQ